MNVQHILIKKLMLSEFELSLNVTIEATKFICYAKGDGAVDSNTENRRLNKFRSG